MSGTITFPISPDGMQLVSRYSTTFISRAHSGKTMRRSRGGHSWIVKVGWSVLDRDQYSDLLAFLINQAGQYETFQLALPVHSTPRGSWAGAPVVDGSDQVGHQIQLQGFTPAAQDVVKPYDLFKFSGHDKIYVAVEETDPDTDGFMTLNFRPDLVQSPVNGEALTTGSVEMTVALLTDIAALPLRGAGLASLEIELEEVW